LFQKKRSLLGYSIIVIDTPSHGPDVAKGLSSLLSPYLSISYLSNKTCIISVNIRSFNKNYSQLKDLVMRCPGILAIAVQETCGKTGARMLPGFQPLVARTRTDKGGGGVGFLMRTGTAFTQNDSLFIQGLFETISITLAFDGKITKLVNLYKPPGLAPWPKPPYICQTVTTREKLHSSWGFYH
jgi:hypothetical protein